MKSRSMLFLITLILLSCKVQPDAVRNTTHDYQDNPPGTVWLRDSIYMDQSEVRNVDYVEYLHWLKEHDTIAYSAALPDTTVWRDKSNYNEPYVKYYLRHPAYRDYPVVGVSYDQAVDFCKWRTQRVKEFTAKKVASGSKHYKIYKNFEYRLPTKEEWEYGAAAGNIADTTGDYIYNGSEFGFESIIDKHNLPKVWVSESWTLYGTYHADIYVPVNSKPPNRFGLYGMIGNVAEMINIRGVSKGGSVFTPLYDCAFSESIPYTKRAAWLGFRCVCVIK